MTELVERVARAIAENYGEDYDAVPKHKTEWVAVRGEYQGRFRDVNEPFRCEYDEMARAAILSLLRGIMEPTLAMTQAGGGYATEKHGIAPWEIEGVWEVMLTQKIKEVEGD